LLWSKEIEFYFPDDEEDEEETDDKQWPSFDELLDEIIEI